VRRFVCIFLLMLLPLHSFAMQGSRSWAESRFDTAHEVDHLQGASHHHGPDGSLHYDDSDESAAHFADHSACQQLVLLPSAFTPLLTLPLLTIKLHELGYHLPNPFLERPQRPPLHRNLG